MPDNKHQNNEFQEPLTFHIPDLRATILVLDEILKYGPISDTTALLNVKNTRTIVSGILNSEELPK